MGRAGPRDPPFSLGPASQIVEGQRPQLQYFSRMDIPGDNGHPLRISPPVTRKSVFAGWRYSMIKNLTIALTVAGAIAATGFTPATAGPIPTMTAAVGAGCARPYGRCLLARIRGLARVRAGSRVRPGGRGSRRRGDRGAVLRRRAGLLLWRADAVLLLAAGLCGAVCVWPPVYAPPVYARLRLRTRPVIPTGTVRAAATTNEGYGRYRPCSAN